MMVLTEGQMTHFRLRAGWIAGELQIELGLKYTQDQLAGWLAGQLQEACGIGYSIALDEVRSTPWEFLFQSIGPSANENEGEANRNAAQGWEYLTSDGRWLIWRRRKAVRELEAQNDS